MRIFETIGNGTPLLTPRGVYPEGLEDGLDYFSFDSVDDISQRMKQLLSEPEDAHTHAQRAKARMVENFSKDRQYERFFDFISRL